MVSNGTHHKKSSIYGALFNSATSTLEIILGRKNVEDINLFKHHLVQKAKLTLKTIIEQHSI